MPIFSKSLAFAVTAASQRDLFQVPLATRQQAFLSPSQPALVTPQAGVMAAYSPAAVLGEPVYVMEDTEPPQEPSSWVGWGALAAAAVAGAAIGRAAAPKPAEATPADELPSVVVQNELRKATNQKLFMLSVGGQEAVDSEADATFSRRKLIAGFAATAPLVAAAIPAFAINFEKDGGNQDGKSTDAFGATGGQKTVANGGSLVGTKGAFQSGRSGGKIPEIRIAGTWNDAAHPGCTRKIAVNGSKAFISGADEDGKKFKVTGEVKGKSIIVDFTPKGGPADVEAKFVIGKGLVFPDGNVWSKA